MVCIIADQVLLSRSIAPLLVQVFRACPDSDAAANAALCVKRLAVEGPSVCQVFVAAHVIDYLVIMLRNRCGLCVDSVSIVVLNCCVDGCAVFSAV